MGLTFYIFLYSLIRRIVLRYFQCPSVEPLPGPLGYQDYLHLYTSTIYITDRQYYSGPKVCNNR